MMESLAKLGVDPFAELGRDDPTLTRLPFAYVFGRSHNAVSFYGANVFPEMVTVGLDQPGIADRVTGKFVMTVQEDANRDARFTVVVELAAGATASSAFEAAVAESVGTHVARLSSEYGNYVPADRSAPRGHVCAPGGAGGLPA